MDIVEVNLGFTSCSAICNKESLSGEVLDRFVVIVMIWLVWLERFLAFGRNWSSLVAKLNFDNLCGL